MSVPKRALLAGAITAAIAFSAIPVGVAAGATTCTPRQNIELILDDSGSMSVTDSNNLRVTGSKLLLNKSGNKKKTFGAVQFGTGASTVFAPGLVAANLAGMTSALDAQIKADDGSTNYNAAFDKAKADNPNANARIFLTDGGHNFGPYAEGHRGGPRTDVIGFGTSTFGEDGARLQRIAAETGGTYYPQTDATKLVAAMNQIDATLNCLAPPTTFVDPVSAQGATVNHAVPVKSSTRSLDAVLSWTGPANLFDIISARIVRGGRTVAQSKRRKRTRLKITRTRGSTFVAIKIARVKKGKLKFRIRAQKLLAPESVTTQITQSKRR